MRFLRLACVRCGLALTGMLSLASTSRAQFEELVRRVPSEANSLILIDAERLFASPIALRERWKEKQVANFASRPLYVPPQATRVVRAAAVDLHTHQSQWEVSLVELPGAPSIEQIAKREKGYIDQIASTQAAWSPRGAYVVKVRDDVLGLVFPPNRQFLARWLKEPPGKVSSYLLQASESMKTTDAQLLLAFDLEDAFDPAQVRPWIAELDAVKKSGLDPAEVTKAVVGLRGVKFELVLKDKAWGRLTLDFGQDPARLALLVKPIILDTLRDMGASLDDIESWTESHKGNSVSLHGELSASGLMRLSSVFELPSLDIEPTSAPEGESASAPAEAEKPVLYATQEHFKSVDKLIRDLLAQKSDAKALGQLALWAEKYAQRIDRLPLLDVDPDMQAYSAGVAEDLRQISFSLKGAGIQSGVRTANVYHAYGYDGYYGNRNVSSERRAIRAQERGQSATSSTEIANQIRADTSAIRRKMTEKYKAEF